MKAGLAILILILAILGGGVAFLAAWEIPAPSTTVEREIPNERLPR
jgi:hypothetical protein